LSMFLFQFSDYASSDVLANADADEDHRRVHPAYADAHTPARSKEKVL
jgi:hypothetical protein